MTGQFDLSQLEWKLSGWAPNVWRCRQSIEIGTSPLVEIRPIPARVPGSVQSALLEAGVIQDWNHDFNSRDCEWIENRHWVYETRIPDEWLKESYLSSLECLGLDYSGWVIINGVEVYEFNNTFVPHTIDITPHLKESDNILQIVLDCPPRWLGYCGATSKMTQWKPRFNYTWDWTVRMVQLGIWDSILMHSSNGSEITEFRCTTEANVEKRTGSLRVQASVVGTDGSAIRLSLMSGENEVWSQSLDSSHLENGIEANDLPVEFWWPNMLGDQPLYTLRCELLSERGDKIDEMSRRVGFKSLAWEQCDGAPEEADPWICVVNGQPVFIQGVNWTPIRPNFADVTEEDYRKRLEAYRDIGCNMLRVWGGAILEKECFYNICDELGLMVWQEFPLSSSWIEDWPPEDKASIDDMAKIAASYIARRQHHVSLALWCGGNELQGSLDGAKTGTGKPIDCSHPMMQRLSEIVVQEDHGHRFVPASASGPREFGEPNDFGKGLHWDVHGPWNVDKSVEGDWSDYWQNDDALLRSEVGCPGAAPVELIRHHFGDLSAGIEPFFNVPCASWTQWARFTQENGHAPHNLGEYVSWSQERQARALGVAVRSCKERFPKCGGIILWMGHDSFPCVENTSILDYDGKPKPSAHAVANVFREIRKESTSCSY